MTFEFRRNDALLIIDVQRDFLPGGALAVPAGDAVIPVLNRYIALAERHGIPIVASRDWHPRNHCSFRPGGPWPPHCIAQTEGAQFSPDLRLPRDAIIVSKATDESADAYSAFQGTGLAVDLRARGVQRLWIGGLATDYCVLSTVLDARKEGFDVFLLEDASRPVEVHTGDGARAVTRMRDAGAVPISYTKVSL
ncbi:MAG: nicotinamidase [Burkholderiales bacterium]